MHPRRSRVPKIVRSLRDVERATALLKGRVKPGPISLGKTRSRVAGIRGVGSVEKLFRQAGSEAKKLRTLTYSITIKGPDGRVIESAERITIPRVKRGASRVEFAQRVRAAIWGRVRAAFDREEIETDPVRGKRIKRTRTGARRLLKGPVMFQVEVFAEKS